MALGAANYLSTEGTPAAETLNAEQDALVKWRMRDYPAENYVGERVCAECHSEKASSQSGTPMAHALEPAKKAQVLRDYPLLTFRDGPYTYRIMRKGEENIYSVSDGVRTIAEPISYPFGSGEAGQTYVFAHDGHLIESRVTFYQSLGGLDITGGQPHETPASLEAALGRTLSPEDARGCFGCHAPMSVTSEGVKLDNVIRGITCESCHGAGRDHALAMHEGKAVDTKIFNPGKLNPFSLSQEFCGNCHRGFDQVMQMPAQGGLNNLRFQPYRMFNSRGHNKGDPRTSCIACHDPHTNRKRSAASYDSRCIACHEQTASRAGSCSVAKSGCTNCHMPKIEVGEMHTRFADHWIRVVQPGAPVPR
jgi:hypothetical protein